MKLSKEEYYFLKKEILSRYFVFSFLNFLCEKGLLEDEHNSLLFDKILEDIGNQKDLGEKEIKRYIKTHLTKDTEDYIVEAYLSKGLYNIENIKKEAEIQDIWDTFERFDKQFKEKLASFVEEVVNDAVDI